MSNDNNGEQHERSDRIDIAPGYLVVVLVAVLALLGGITTAFITTYTSGTRENFVEVRRDVELLRQDLDQEIASLRDGLSAPDAGVFVRLRPNPPMDRDGRREDSGRG